MTSVDTILVDTCGWIEWLTNGSLSEQYEPYFGQIETMIVPTSVQYELYKWVTRQAGIQKALEAIRSHRHNRTSSGSTTNYIHLIISCRYFN